MASSVRCRCSLRVSLKRPSSHTKSTGGARSRFLVSRDDGDRRDTKLDGLCDACESETCVEPRNAYPTDPGTWRERSRAVRRSPLGGNHHRHRLSIERWRRSQPERKADEPAQPLQSLGMSGSRTWWALEGIRTARGAVAASGPKSTLQAPYGAEGYASYNLFRASMSDQMHRVEGLWWASLVLRWGRKRCRFYRGGKLAFTGIIGEFQAKMTDRSDRFLAAAYDAGCSVARKGRGPAHASTGVSNKLRCLCRTLPIGAFSTTYMRYECGCMLKNRQTRTVRNRAACARWCTVSRANGRSRSNQSWEARYAYISSIRTHACTVSIERWKTPIPDLWERSRAYISSIRTHACTVSIERWKTPIPDLWERSHDFGASSGFMCRAIIQVNRVVHCMRLLLKRCRLSVRKILATRRCGISIASWSGILVRYEIGIQENCSALNPH